MPDYIATKTCRPEFTYIGLKTNIRYVPDAQNKDWQYRYVYSVVMRYLSDNIFFISPVSASPTLDSEASLSGSINGGPVFNLDSLPGMGNFKLINQTIRPFNSGGCEQMEVYDTWTSVSYDSTAALENGYNYLDWVLATPSLPPTIGSLEDSGTYLDNMVEDISVQYRDETSTLEERLTIFNVTVSEIHDSVGSIWPAADLATQPWGTSGSINNVSTNGGGPVNISSGMSNLIGTSFEITPHGKRGGKLSKVSWEYRSDSKLYKQTWE